MNRKKTNVKKSFVKKDYHPGLQMEQHKES